VDNARLATIAGTGRVGRSFAFIDLCGFTDFSDDFGDEEAVAELQRLRLAVRNMAPLFGVRVDKWLGDGVMLVGVESESLVAAVVAVAQRHEHQGHLALRAGLAVGDVLSLEGDDYVGRVVNLASRLCDAAEAGTVLAATEGLAVPEWVRVTDERLVPLRGMGAPVPAALLTTDLVLFEHARPSLGALVSGLTRPVRAALRESGLGESGRGA